MEPHYSVLACSQTLSRLQLGGYQDLNSPTLKIPNLSSLILKDHYLEDLLYKVKAPRLKHVEALQLTLLSLPFKNLVSLNLEGWKDRSGETDEETCTLVESANLISLVERQASTLCQSLPHSLGLLTELHISDDQVFDVDLLAETMLSRNPCSRGHNVNDLESSKCDVLTLYLDSEHLKRFHSAEKKLLSRCSRETVGASGKTKVEFWNRKCYEDLKVREIERMLSFCVRVSVSRA